MWKRLGLGLLLVACSSESGTLGGEQAGGDSGVTDVAGASGTKLTNSGGTHSATSSAPSVGGEGGEALAVVVGDNGGGGDDSTDEAGGGAIGSGGEPSNSDAGSGVTAGSPSLGGSGGSAGGVATGGAGAAGHNTGGSSAAGSGGSGGAPGPDACGGIAHWSATERWTDYAQGDQRVFGGFIWHCQAPAECTSYPGKASSPGWFKDATCAGGPTNEVATCQCAAGSCCDGCYLRSRSYFCGEVVRSVRCSPPSGEEGDYWNLFCDGLSAGDCTRWAVHTKYATGSCASGVTCQSSSAETACTPLVAPSNQ